jgi:hypothetical protein
MLAPADTTPRVLVNDTQEWVAQEAFELKAPTLEQQIEELKERIIISERFNLLRSDGPHVVIRQRNDTMGVFRLESFEYSIDNHRVFSAGVDTPAFSSAAKGLLPVFDGRISPGTHDLEGVLTLRSHGSGVFSYLEGSRFTVTQRCSFEANRGDNVTVVVGMSWNEGSFIDLPRDRIVVRCTPTRKPDLHRPVDPDAPGWERGTPVVATSDQKG